VAELIDLVRRWCTDTDFSCEDGEDGGLRVQLDPAGASARVDLPSGMRPARVHTVVELPEAADLTAAQLDEVIEEVVLGRSGLVDARRCDDRPAAEVVVVIYPEGLNRHQFVAALFECQKVQLLLHRELKAARAAAETMAALEALEGRRRRRSGREKGA
jgi:hypothetical protein